MDRKWKVFTIEQDRLFSTDLFYLLVEFLNATDLIHGAMMYFYHHESYFLDELDETLTLDKISMMGHDVEDIRELSKIIDDAKTSWLDSFYPSYEKVFEGMSRERRYIYHRTIHSHREETVTFVFRLRSFHEPFHPAY